MKKLFFTLLACCAMFVSAHAQNCTPDSVTYPGYGLHPSSMPDGKANVAYAQTIQFRFPSDTEYMSTKLHINSVTIDSVRMPKSFTYKCNNTNCTYKGGEYGCIQITGNPTDSQIGSHRLLIHFTASVIFFGNSLPIGDTGSVAFKITSNSGIFYQSLSASISANQNFPNPFSTSTEIQFLSDKNQSASFKVTNELGQQVAERTIQATQGVNSFNFERNNLPAGMYFYSILSGNDMVTRRMVIKD